VNDCASQGGRDVAAGNRAEAIEVILQGLTPALTLTGSDKGGK